MCAMMPMLRTFVRSVSTSCATVSLPCRLVKGPVKGSVKRAGAGAPGALLPAVVREGLVRLGHLVHVLAALHRGTEAVARVEDLVHQALGHGLLAAVPRVADQPSQREGRRAARPNLDRHLVGRAADAAGAGPPGRLDVVERALEGDDPGGGGLVAGAPAGAPDQPPRPRP